MISNENYNFYAVLAQLQLVSAVWYTFWYTITNGSYITIVPLSKHWFLKIQSLHIVDMFDINYCCMEWSTLLLIGFKTRPLLIPWFCLHQYRAPHSAVKWFTHHIPCVHTYVLKCTIAIVPGDQMQLNGAILYIMDFHWNPLTFWPGDPVVFQRTGSAVLLS